VLAVIALAGFHLQGQAPAAGGAETIDVDGNAASHPFPHFWEEMFGSGRAILSLRQDYRDDLHAVKKITDFQYVRFHAIFDDDVGPYNEARDGGIDLNFSYVDQIYDGLLANGVRPFVELSFMPKALSSNPDAIQPFWYQPNVAPPKDYSKWEAMIRGFARHLVDRYGEDEVAKWYFEVWNEPNIDFWAGVPKQQSYFDLYDHTARALKSVSPRIRVGGPATAQAAWVDQFIQHASSANVPVDFVSTHVYGNDSAHDVFGIDENIPRTQMVCRAVRKVHDQIAASPHPKLPLIWSEFNASYKNEENVTDAPFMGPWLADTIRQCDGMTEMMSYWTFSDVFEEQGVIKKPFYGGFGILAEGGVPKPAFNAFALLHRLGHKRLDVASASPSGGADSVLITKRANGSLVIALWNLFPPEEQGTAKKVTLHLTNVRGATHAKVWIIDATHGSPLPAYQAMGSPAFPTAKQFEALKRAAELPLPMSETLTGNSLTLILQPQALALVELAVTDAGWTSSDKGRVCKGKEEGSFGQKQASG
jgi:xylan 1,4-beta-xylosidase